MTKKRIRTWNSDWAYRLYSQIRDRSEQRLFHGMLAQNELDDFDLRFLAKRWSEEQVGTESMCSFLVRVGWLTPGVDMNAGQQYLSDGDEKAEYCCLSSSAQMEMQKVYKSISGLSNFIGWLTQLSLRRPGIVLEKSIHLNIEAEVSFAVAKERSQTLFLKAPVEADPYSTICTADLLVIPLTALCG